MNLSIFKIGEIKKLSSMDELESATIDWLRFPLALAVVFIHDFGTKDINLVFLHKYPTSLISIYDFIRIVFSNIATHFAVPTFFLFSGYLFFYKMNVWNRNTYKKKIVKRFKSLLIPYVLWNCIYILYIQCLKLGGIILKGKPLSGIWEFVTQHHGLSMFWDSEVWGFNNTNLLGYSMVSSSPILIPLWFLRDLIVVVLFTPLIYYLIKKLDVFFIVILSLCYLSNIFIVIPGFSIDSFFWFSFGAYFSINKKNMVEILYKYRFQAILISILTLIPLVWFNGRIGDGVTTNRLAQILYPIYVTGAVVSSISISAALLKKQIVGVNQKLAKATFFIFLSHIFILNNVSLILNKVFIQANYVLRIVVYIVSPFLTIIICVALFELLNKFTPKLLSFLVGSRK